MISQQIIDNILDSADIEQVVRDAGIKLKKAGVNYTGSCPFHNEKTGSFVVSPAKGIYKCFGCGEGGNVLSFVMKHEKLSFIEAIKFLAAKTNIIIEEEKLTPEKEEENKLKEQLYIVYEAAAKYFEEQLQKHEKAKDYASGRFTPQTISLFRIGYAPEGWQNLYDYLRANGFKPDILEKSDLFRVNKEKRLYDFFRNRLMFPVFDRTNRIIAFSGRAFADNEAKYLNNSDSILYNKGKVLYGLHQAIPAIKKYDVCVLVEGNPDVVKLHQLDVNNVVAASGTALTDDQIILISKYTKNFCLLYDSDDAGKKATQRNAEKILEAGFNVLVLNIPDEDGKKQDPDSFFDSKQKFATFYEDNARSYLLELAKSKRHKCDNNPDYTAKTMKQLARFFYKRTETERESIITELNEIIKGKVAWKNAVKEHLHQEKRETKQLEIDGRTNEQNKSFEKYCFYTERNCYWFAAQKGQGVFKGSNFVMEPLFHIESTYNAKRLYRITNEFNISRIVEFAQKDLISIQAFKLRCESLGNFRFDAGDYGLSKIKAYLYEMTKTCKEITQMGWQKEGFWAWANGIISNGEFKPINEEGVVVHNNENFYIPACSSFYASDDKLFEFERKFTNKPGTINLRSWSEKFLSVYGDNAVVGLSYYIATLFRDVIVSMFRFFPILNIFGPKGTGKSEMAISLSQLFGNLPVGINITNSTVASLANHISATRNAICHVDEFKNVVDIDKVEFLKGIWDGVGRTRLNMDKDKKKETTAVDAGVVLTGQEMTTKDIALFSRVLYLTVHKKEFSTEEQIRYAELKVIEQEGLTQITNEILTHRSYFVANYSDNYSKAESELSKIIDKNSFEDRIWKNWLVVLSAYRTLKDVLYLPIKYEELLIIFAEMIKRQNLETKKHNDTSNFWEVFTYLVRDGILEEGYDYRIEVPKTIKTDKLTDMPFEREVLLIDKSRVFMEYSKLGARASFNILPQASLEFYLQNSNEFLGTKKFRFKVRTNNLNDKTSVRKIEDNIAKIATSSIWAWCFDYNELKLEIQTSFIEDDEFEKGNISKKEDKQIKLPF